MSYIPTSNFIEKKLFQCKYYKTAQNYYTDNSDDLLKKYNINLYNLKFY